MCVTWDLSSGNINIYVDGRKSFDAQGDKYVTTNLPAGGTWVIGQDQRPTWAYPFKIFRGFAKKNSMKGVLADVNIWDRILCPNEVALLASSCSRTMKGNIKSHNDFALRGGVATFKPICCLGN